MTGLLEAIGPRTTILNATDAGAPLYEKLDFRTTGIIQQHQGAGFRVPDAPLPSGGHIRPATMADLPAMTALDSAATGLERPHVLTALLAVAEPAILEQDGRPVGFAVCRAFGRGRVVGPIVAPDAEGPGRSSPIGCGSITAASCASTFPSRPDSGPGWSRPACPPSPRRSPWPAARRRCREPMSGCSASSIRR